MQDTQKVESNETVQTPEAAALPVEAPALQAEAPEDVASRLYSMLLPQYKAQRKQLSKKGLLRVLDTLILSPLEDVNFIMSDRLERNVAAVSSRMLDAKFIMITYVMNEAMAEAQAAEEAKVENGNGSENTESQPVVE
jgi:hypothetical protein